MAKIELLPCPFCGSKKMMFGYAFKPGHNDSRKIECAECESHGPIRDGKQAAADAWNERVREWKMSERRLSHEIPNKRIRRNRILPAR